MSSQAGVLYGTQQTYGSDSHVPNENFFFSSRNVFLFEQMVSNQKLGAHLNISPTLLPLPMELVL